MIPPNKEARTAGRQERAGFCDTPLKSKTRVRPFGRFWKLPKTPITAVRLNPGEFSAAMLSFLHCGSVMVTACSISVRPEDMPSEKCRNGTRVPQFGLQAHTSRFPWIDRQGDAQARLARLDWLEWERLPYESRLAVWLVLLPSLTTPHHHPVEVAMAFKSLRLALGCFLLALLALVVVPRTFRKEKGTFQVPSRFAPTRALEASVDEQIQAVESMISDDSADLRVASAEEATHVVPQGNESLPSRTVVSDSISAGSAATTRPESAVSEDGQLTTAVESKEDVSSQTRHTDESVPKTALELNEHLLDEDSLQLYQTSMTVVKDAVVSRPKAVSNSLDGLVIAPDCRCTFILSGAHPPADPQCLHNCSRLHFVNNNGGW
ncbi:unnamed protein product [Symbiodinium sp. CCMP2592]|nr:unnamed protein product [Symbiodinium sp. CCMP2592]